MKRTDHARPWRLLSLLLVVFMLASVFPMAAFAEGEETGADAGTTEAKRPEELLLKLDALDKDSATYNPQNLTLTNSEAFDGANHNTYSFVRGTENPSNIVSNAYDGRVRPYGGFTLSTGLPLNTKTSYTVEFYVQRTQAIIDNNLRFCFGFRSPKATNKDGYLFYDTDGRIFILENAGKAISRIGNTWGKTGDTKLPTTTEDFWNSGRNQDGYTRFVFSFDGNTLKIYSGNVEIYSFSGTANIATYSELILVAGCYNNSKNGGAVSGSITTIPDATVMADLKDISIYSGAYTPQELDGINTAKIVGWQDTVNEDNVNKTRKMRIIGGIYDLTGDNIGFDILVEYKDADGNAQQKKFRRMSENSKVYTSILADGETVTAASKGVNYLFEIVIDDIPSDVTDLQFTVAPFKLIGEERVFGAKKNFTMEMNPK